MSIMLGNAGQARVIGTVAIAAASAGAAVALGIQHLLKKPEKTPGNSDRILKPEDKPSIPSSQQDANAAEDVLPPQSDPNKNVYETQRYVNEYLLLHFGEADDVLRHSFVPMDSLEFPRKVAKECLDAYNRLDKTNLPSRAFDVGCGLGRTAFELARVFEESIGLEYSAAFVEACNKMKEAGQMAYSVCEEGDVTSSFIAKVDPEIERSRTKFIEGDACNLPEDLGQFGCVVAANLLCRLPNPHKFLERVPDLVASGGLLVLTTPCTWLEDFTPKKYWLGGYYDESNKPVTTFDTLKRILGPNFILLEEKNMRFFIRETARKNQWVVTQCTIWKRK